MSIVYMNYLISCMDLAPAALHQGWRGRDPYGEHGARGEALGHRDAIPALGAPIP